MTRKTLLQHLDVGVQSTGIPAALEGRPRRRPLRWFSTIALALAGAGFMAGIVRPGTLLSYPLIALGFCAANFIPLWGPLKPWGGQERTDEFDQLLRARAFLVALTALSAVAVLGLWLIVGLSMIQNWSTDVVQQRMVQLALLLAVIYSAGPTCYASWTQMPIDDAE